MVAAPMTPELAAHLRFEHRWSWERVTTALRRSKEYRGSSYDVRRAAIEGAAERMGYTEDAAREDTDE